MSAVVAGRVSAFEFGLFAIVFSAYSLAVSVGASMSTQVVAIRFAGADDQTARRVMAIATGLTLMLGVTVGLISACVSFFWSGSSKLAFAAFSCVAFMLLAQECWRSLFVALGYPRKAFLNNVCWSIVLIGALAFLVTAQAAEAWTFVFAWGGSAGVAAVFGVWQAGVRPEFRGCRRWLIQHRSLVLPIILSTAATLGATQVAMIVVASVGSLDQVGAIRGALTLLGPINVIAIAAAAFVTPEVARRTLGPRKLVLVALLLSGFLVFVTTLWSAVLLLVPFEIGSSLLGDSWRGSREALPGIALQLTCIAAIAGATTVLRSLDRAGLALASSACLGLLYLIAAPVGAVWGGTEGAAYGFGIAAAGTFIPTWILFFRGVKLGKRQSLVEQTVPLYANMGRESTSDCR